MLSVLGVCAQQHKITDPVVTGRLLATSCPLASSWSTPLYCQGIDSTQSGKSEQNGRTQIQSNYADTGHLKTDIYARCDTL